MANFRLEWLQLNDDGTITGIVGVEKLTLADDTHHTFTPPQHKLRRHSIRIAARIVYASSRLFIKSDRLGQSDVTSETGYMFRHGMDSDGSILENNFLWEVQQGEAIYIHHTGISTMGYAESA